MTEQEWENLEKKMRRGFHKGWVLEVISVLLAVAVVVCLIAMGGNR